MKLFNKIKSFFTKDRPSKETVERMQKLVNHEKSGITNHLVDKVSLEDFDFNSNDLTAYALSGLTDEAKEKIVDIIRNDYKNQAELKSNIFDELVKSKEL